MGREGLVVQISHNRFLRDARTAEGLGSLLRLPYGPGWGTHVFAIDLT